MALYDISPLVSPAIAVWPGDTPFARHLSISRAEGASVNVSALNLSTHTGSHVDAPFHFEDDGDPVDKLPLEPFLGPALLVAAEGAARVGWAEIGAALSRPVERLLVRTRHRSNPDRFDTAFSPLEPDAARRLVDLGIRLYGTDAASVDPFDSKTLETHRILSRGGVMILEGLVLDAPPAGEYELIALPLRIAGADASPVRAILRTRGAGVPIP